MKSTEIVLASVQDKLRQCEERSMLTNTAFLDASDCAFAEREFAYSKHILYGGYEDAERRVMIFLPDYYNELPEDDNPLTVLRCEAPKGAKKLTHRDFLGAILALGVDRSVVGDILIHECGADIIVLKSMAEFFLLNFTQVARSSINTKEVSIDELSVSKADIIEKNDTVASLRLDNLVASAFNLSRAGAQEAINNGSVFVNGIQCIKPDRTAEAGDKLVLRGKGKSVLKEIGKVTRKDRIFIILEIYK